MKRPARWKIGQLEEATGATRDTIHFYLKEGLLPPPEKTGATAAWYGREHLDRLLRIGALRDAGLSIPTVQRVLAEGGDALPLAALAALGARLAPFEPVYRTRVEPRSPEADTLVEALGLAPWVDESPALSQATDALAALPPALRAVARETLAEMVPRLLVWVADECALNEGAVDAGTLTPVDARAVWDASGAVLQALRDAHAARLRRRAGVARVTPARGRSRR